MTTSAFKSRRGNHKFDSNSIQETHGPVVRKRSMSVSAISRTKQSVDVSSDFSNKRENPLFWSSISSHTDELSNKVVAGMGKPPEKEKKMEKAKGIAEEQRGRSVTRNSGVKAGIGRSLSRVRQRSLSRGPCRADENEKEQEVDTSTVIRNRDLKQVGFSVKNANASRNVADMQGRVRGSHGTSSQCKATESSEDDSACSFQISSWEDGMTSCSLSETEDKTMKAVCEQLMSFQVDHQDNNIPPSGIYETVQSEVRRAISDIQSDIESAIRRNTANSFATTNVADTPPDLVSPGAVELLSDIRREYARKLEESEERARKLRADLVVEEHHGQELSRILKEILPDPKTSNPQKSRPGRKRSSERKKMSKRLTEEAMAYFDECVSISTFDSSDFSAPEDPPYCLSGPSVSVGGTVSTPQGHSRINSPLIIPGSCSNIKQDLVYHDQREHSCQGSNLLTNNSGYEYTRDQVAMTGEGIGKSQERQFHFAKKPMENFELHDIKSYITHFERGTNKNLVSSDCKRSNYDADEYNLHGCIESLFFDRVLFRSRTESGGLHLCTGSVAVPFSPFGSVI